MLSPIRCRCSRSLLLGISSLLLSLACCQTGRSQQPLLSQPPELFNSQAPDSLQATVSPVLEENKQPDSNAAQDELAQLKKRIEALEAASLEESQKRAGGRQTKSDSGSTAQTPPPDKTNAEKSNAEKTSVDIKSVDIKSPDIKSPDIKSPDKKSAEKKSTDKPSNDKHKDDWQDVSGEKWNVRLGGHVQMDYITWPHTDERINDPAEGNYFSFRRLRLLADGTGYGVYDFRLQMTLEPGQGSNTNANASPDVKDAYFTVNEIPLLGRMRIGNFFVPFGLEQVTNDTNNIFLERSIPTQGIFTADREVGLAFYNCTPDKNMTSSSGIFFDDINDTFKTRIDNNQGLRLSQRVTWLPYYDEPSDGRYLIHTGAGVLYTNDYDDRVRFRARPQVQRGPVLIDSGDLPADSYITSNLELALVWGRFTIQNEAYLSNVHLLGGDTVRANGAYTHISYFLTGENRIYERFGQHGAQFGRNKPFSNFFATPGGMGWGAWEAKARWSYLDLTDMNRGQYNDLSAGLNWYWSDRTRIMLDWIHPWTDSKALFGSTASDLLGMRFDFSW